jgi:hypothetical protein
MYFRILILNFIYSGILAMNLYAFGDFNITFLCILQFIIEFCIFQNFNIEFHACLTLILNFYAF